jgi:HTH-like domain
MAQRRAQSAREENVQLVEQIKDVFASNQSRYGSPRITKVLRQQGFKCGKNRIARLMQENKLRARGKKVFRPRTTVAGSSAGPGATAAFFAECLTASIVTEADPLHQLRHNVKEWYGHFISINYRREVFTGQDLC